MSNFKDDLRAPRSIIPGDWIAPGVTSLPIGMRLKKVECHLILTPNGFSYEERWEGGSYGLEISRDELATVRLELTDHDRYVRVVTPERGDEGFRLPHPLGLRLLAWQAGQAGYGG